MTCSPVDSHASLSALLENEKERRMTVISGRKCFESFDKSPRSGSSAKTLAASLLGRMDWYSKRCALTWKVRGMKFNRLLFRLVPSGHRTAATEYGLSPTQNLSSLASQCLWPTPVASDCHGGTAKPAKTEDGDKRRMNTLKDFVCRLIGRSSPLNAPFVAEMMGYPTDWTLSPFQRGTASPSRPTETR